MGNDQANVRCTYEICFNSVPYQIRLCDAGSDGRKNRNNLTEFVYRQWSLFFAAGVDIPDSHKHERFRLVYLTWFFLGFNLQKRARRPTQTHRAEEGSMKYVCYMTRTMFI